jgi:arylsulfatase A-like enzyme
MDQGSEPGKRRKISRRTFVRSTLGAAALAGCSTFRSARPGTESGHSLPPNLLFVFSDQQSYDMLGCYGNEQIITPNIDSLADQGVRFLHCISSQPLCTPYRGMLMSGQHPLYCGTMSNDIQMIPENGVSFAEALRNAGYRTAYIGKWHLHGGDRNRPIPVGPLRYGFDDLFLSNNCQLDYRPGHCFYWNEAGEKVFFDEWEVYGQTKQALAFLDTCTADHPFALFVSWHPPHDMGFREGDFYYDTEPDLMALYDRSSLRLRPNVEDTPQVRRKYHGHMAMCSGVDRALGRLIAKLNEKDLSENTIVVFTSDHGDLLESHGRPWAKSFPEDESCRVPLIIRYPHRLKAGITTDLLTGTLDLMPTILGLMGIPVPNTCQGRDLSWALRERRENEVDSVPLFNFFAGWRGVYTRQYTFAFDQLDGNTKHDRRVLYDRKKDPFQLENLYHDRTHRSLHRELHRLTIEWMDRFEDPCIDRNDLLRLCGFESAQLTKKGETGILPGRPIDLIREAKEFKTFSHVGEI